MYYVILDLSRTRKQYRRNLRRIISGTHLSNACYPPTALRRKPQANESCRAASRMGELPRNRVGDSSWTNSDELTSRNVYIMKAPLCKLLFWRLRNPASYAIRRTSGDAMFGPCLFAPPSRFNHQPLQSRSGWLVLTRPNLTASKPLMPSNR